ncbi:hypothetical protein [Plebeiibacterium sediminum]|uniref:Uncharacterized protein n=1 Tax=Plebeiibacterium sediminum TaxID=2992112 RepID=A0AAE3SH95_9BACT|nr:hypothetical protein [Plebeiobacterium sediminum]MCW3789151.1 hypothetical protein [Plebeiobacterium sediminum]
MKSCDSKVMFTGTRSALIRNRFPMKYVLVRWPVQLARAGVGGRRRMWVILDCAKGRIRQGCGMKDELN